MGENGDDAAKEGAGDELVKGGQRGIIHQYLWSRSDEYRELAKLRKEGWDNPAGDKWFAAQRARADAPSKKNIAFMFRMMQNIGAELQHATGAFTSHLPAQAPRNILDLCMAPGGFLSVALQNNPGAYATAFTLPELSGGHPVVLESDRMSVKFADITMLAEDMGILDVPPNHPDAENFLPRQLDASRKFGLILCDGQVLRTQERSSYREHCEARRLTAAQLSLGLEHLAPGGTMVVLLHKLEDIRNISLLRTFDQFADVKLHKPKTSHCKRSSFYMIATQTQSQDPRAVAAIQRWKAMWKSATFDIGADLNWPTEGSISAVEVLKEYGPRLIELGREVWKTQAQGLAGAPFMKLSRG